MSKYVLHYLNVPARGELIRVIFKYADVEYDEKFIAFADVKEIVKSNDIAYPLGKLPTLQVGDDQYICESHAIVRYLAREFNLYGTTNMEKVVIDQVLDSLKNLEENLWRNFFWREGEEQANGIKNAFENIAPRAFKFIERLIKANNAGSGYLVGDNITIADIHVMITIESVLLDNNTSYRDILDKYPLVKALNEKVRNNDIIKKYLDTRGPPVYKLT